MKKVFYSLSMGPDGDDLHVCHCSTGEAQSSGLVLFSHGFGGNGAGDHRMFMEIVDVFVVAGIACVLFDYRGCGYSGGKFEDLTPSREVQDLLAVYSFVCENLVGVNTRVGVLSQSHGSYIALLAMPKMYGLAAACLWGGSTNPYGRYSGYFDRLQQVSELFILGHGLAIHKRFLEDMGRQDAEISARAIRCPVRVVHAGRDEKVPLEEGRHVYEMLTCVKDLVVIEGANHSYKMQFDLQKKAVDVTLDWFLKHLLCASAAQKV